MRKLNIYLILHIFLDSPSGTQTVYDKYKIVEDIYRTISHFTRVLVHGFMAKFIPLTDTFTPSEVLAVNDGDQASEPPSRFALSSITKSLSIVI